ncbi:MAG TPA: hypothetical protein VF600_10725 [Abditibacteriaceae bacterium]|jgi:hypothetical protein
MTLIIEVAPAVENALQAQAVQRGVSVQELAAAVLRDYVVHIANGETNSDKQSKRQQAAQQGFGILAGGGRSVEDFLRERHEEAEREMQATAGRSKRLRTGQAETAS